MSKLKIIIAGSRDFNDYDLLSEKMDYYTRKCFMNEIQIVNGGARGADSLGAKYAESKGIDVINFPANWDKYGKSAGYRRNEEMAKYATHCVVFWDGESPGTKHMIDLAIAYGITLRIVNYN